MPVLGVIPARLESSRLPRKPLLPLAGDPLIVWVARRVADAALCDRVVVATDAREIAVVVERAGFEAVMTSQAPQSGTERVAEVTAQQSFTEFDVILNVQGDEPLVALEALSGALGCLKQGQPIGTAAGSLDPHLAADPNRVKVVVSPAGRALYFSRAPIPFDRDGTGHVVYHQHVGGTRYARGPGALGQAATGPRGRWSASSSCDPCCTVLPSVLPCSTPPRHRESIPRTICVWSKPHWPDI